MSEIPDVDARKVMEEMSRKADADMFPQNRARKPAASASPSQQAAAKPGNANDSRPVITLPKPQVQVVQPASTPVVQTRSITVGVPSSPIRVYRRSSLHPTMVKYFPSGISESQPYAPDSSWYLSEGGLARTFYRYSDHDPRRIEVKLQPGESLSFYSGDGEKISFSRIEDVPKDGVMYLWKGRQVFLEFGFISGLDGKSEVALAYKSGHQEVTVKRAKILTSDSLQKNK